MGGEVMADKQKYLDQMNDEIDALREQYRAFILRAEARP